MLESTPPSTPPTTGLTLRLILADQLNPLHSWFKDTRADVVYVLMEVRSETDYVLHHAQKVLGLFAAMRAFAVQLKAAGHRVRYVAIDHPSNQQSITGNLEALLAHYGASAIQYQAPDEWRLDQQLRDWAAACPLPVHMVDSEHFYTARDEAKRLFAGKKQWLMERFYRHQRQQHQVLMTKDGKPEGQQWNFDADNRRPWRGTPAAPADTRPSHDHRELWQVIQSAGIQTMGNPQAAAFRWPLDRGEALQQLEHFITEGLPHFGDYQDAISQHSGHLFHSLLSFALNTKMLHPREVVQRAEQAWQAGLAPLHAVEGFIRQILGWREYIWQLYWHFGPDYRDSNALEAHSELPNWWTELDADNVSAECLRQALSGVRDRGWAHHIQRLMILGSHALQRGYRPDELNDWFATTFVDGFAWVMPANVIGMSQHADGGLMATKPYTSGGAYINKMSDHCRHCPFDPKKRVGDDACPFTAGYWAFVHRHREMLAANMRTARAVSSMNRLSDLEAVLDQERNREVF